VVARLGVNTTSYAQKGQTAQDQLEIQVAVAKVSKWAVSESGDTLEMIERPHGGLSFVLADGQRSGRGAKAISNMVVRKAITLLAEGVRDGAAARAAHDYLYTHRRGQVLATLNILSVDLTTRTLVIARNSHCPVLVAGPEGLRVLDEPSQPIGVYRGTKPVITELPLVAGTVVVVFTDGIMDAGERYGERLDLPAVLKEYLGSGTCHAQDLADGLLERAVNLDRGRPADDMTVLVLVVSPMVQEDGIRRLSVRFPLPPI